MIPFKVFRLERFQTCRRVLDSIAESAAALLLAETFLQQFSSPKVRLNALCSSPPDGPVLAGLGRMKTYIGAQEPSETLQSCPYNTV